MNIIGRKYEDLEGIWQIVGVTEGKAELVCIQKGNVYYGHNFLVPIAEAKYYLRESEVE